MPYTMPNEVGDPLDDALSRIKTPAELLDANPGPGPVELRKPRPPAGPLPQVPEGALPDVAPFRNNEEYVAALEAENRRLVLEIDNRKMRETGTVPFTMRIPDLVKGAIAGGALAVIFKLLGFL